VRFRGMARASESAALALGRRSWALSPRSGSALGAPSAGLSLGGLLASRARLRFTQRRPIYPAQETTQDESAAVAVA
jgi:hypothetical protein